MSKPFARSVGHIPSPSLWPRDKQGVMAVAQDWYTPQRVRVNTTAIEKLPKGFVAAPEAVSTNLEIPSGSAVQKAYTQSVALTVNDIEKMWGNIPRQPPIDSE